MGVSLRQVSIVISFINRSKAGLTALISQLQDVDGQITKLNGRSSLIAGGALASAGVGLTALGIKGVSVMNKMSQAAIDYGKQVSGTMTQVEDKTLYTYQDIYKMGMDYAKKFPIPFEQMQDALYDIFSSVEVTSKGAAEKYMDVISKSVVGGLTTMETAGKSTITMVNAFGKSLQVMGKDGKVAVDEVTQAGNLMFQMVRKGIGSYDDFSSAVGKSASSARAAGQSAQTLGAMLAYMTRKGEPAARAGTSVARAMDMITKTKAVSNFKAIGIEVADANGKFRQMSDIMKDVNHTFRNMSEQEKLENIFKLSGTEKQAIKAFQELGLEVEVSGGKIKNFHQLMEEADQKMKGLSDVEVASMLQSISKGAGGTIQAMRFFKHAVADTDGELDLMVKYMSQAADGTGALDEAFQEMNAAKFSPIQRLTNHLEVLKVTFGEVFASIKSQAAEALIPIAEYFASLDESTVQMIAKIGVIGTAVTLVSGAIMTFLGIMGMVVGGIKTLATAIGAVGKLDFLWKLFKIFGKANWIVLAITAVIAVGVALYENWETVVKYAQVVWDVLVQAWQAIWQMMQDVWSWVVANLGSMWDGFVNGCKMIGDVISNLVETYGPHVERFIDGIVNAFNSFAKLIQPYLETAWNSVKSAFDTICDAVGRAIDFFKPLADFLGGVFHVIGGIIAGVIAVIGHVIGSIMVICMPIVSFLANTLAPVFANVFGTIMSVVGFAINFVINILNIAWQFLSGAFMTIFYLLTGQWSALWDNILSTVANVWESIYSIFKSAWDTVAGIVQGFVNGVIEFFTYLWDVLVGHSIVPDTVNSIIEWFGTMVSTVVDAVMGFVDAVIGFFTDLWNSTVNAVSSMVGSVVGFFTDLWNKVTNAVSNMVNAVVNFFKNLWDRVVQTVSNLLRSVVSKFTEIKDKVVSKVSETISGAVRFFGELPGKVISAIASLAGQLASTVAGWFTTMVSGVSTGIGNVLGWFSGLPNRIVGSIGSVGSLLYGAGRNILQGFLNGLKSAYGAVKNFVGGIAGWIARNKGPKEYDLKLLVPAGGWIMEGLNRGLRNSIPEVKRTLDKVGGIFESAEFNKLQAKIKLDHPDQGPIDTSNYGFRGPRSWNNGSEGPTTTYSKEIHAPIDVTINTKEADADEIASEIGFRVSHVLGV